MVLTLDEIRLRQSEAREEGGFDTFAADGRYAQAFRKYRIDLDAVPPEEAGEAIRASAIRAELLAAMADEPALTAAFTVVANPVSNVS